jgi:hypothetical protein
MSYKPMGFCNLLSYLCCPRRFHQNNVLSGVDVEEVYRKVDEYESLYTESPRLADVPLST